jgi:hypothetical protein
MPIKTASTPTSRAALHLTAAPVLLHGRLDLQQRSLDNFKPEAE